MMKKLALPIGTLIIGSAAGYFAAGSKQTATPATNPATTKLVADKQTPVMTGEYHSENSISYAEAKMLVDTFGTRGLNDASDRPGGKGVKTRSIFLPLTKLDSLIAFLDAARKKDGKTDGIRIYFGRYPKKQLDGKPYEHAHHNTIVLVSTRDSAVVMRGTKKPVHIHMDYFGEPAGVSTLRRSAAVSSLKLDPQNRGELCPNNCNGATLICTDPTDPNCGN